MAAIKHTLQREVFLPNDERLLSVVYVTKFGKKKKASFLCIAVTTERPVITHVYQVKKSERGDTFKKKCSWMLKDLKHVDAKDPNKETLEFDLHFDKVYRWSAGNVGEKDAFISCLWKLSQRHLSEKPEFVNVALHLLEDIFTTQELRPSGQPGDDISMSSEDYQALSSREESDLASLMGQCEFAISNAELFADQLSKDLFNLDGANIHSIMASEGQVLNLMTLLERGIQEAEHIQHKLDKYDQLLKGVKDQMEIMKDKDTLMAAQNENLNNLLTTLTQLVKELDLEHQHVKALLDGDLGSPSGIYQCTAAAEALQRCMAAQIHPALYRMSAVEDQQVLFRKLSSTFAKRLSHHLNNLFIQQGNELETGGTLARYANDLRLPQHHACHRDLTPYAEIMLWLKTTDPDSFNQLSKVYQDSIRKLYDKELREFFEQAKQRLSAQKGDKKLAPTQKLSGSSSSLNRPEDRKRSPSLQIDGENFTGSEHDITTRTKFNQIFDKVLCELEPVCMEEQNFCVKFFHLATESVMDLPEMLPREPPVSTSSPFSSTQDTSVSSTGDVEDDPDSVRRRIHERQISSDIRKMMGALFTALEKELTDFVAFGDKLDPMNSLYMLVSMNYHVTKAEDVGSFLAVTLATCLVIIKRNFDKYVANQLQAIDDSKITKKGRTGILPFVKQFETFATQAESIFQNSDRRADLEKAYLKLVRRIYVQIDNLSQQSPKTPPEVVMMENFHRMHAIMSRIKISVLENDRKEAKTKYQENLAHYVIYHLGRPLEKLNLFFDGVADKVRSGVKMEEIGYQMAYSKQELKKVIKEYPGKEVKKGLEHLKKKVEKHLCEEENLFQVVWHSMQDEFIKQYKYLEQMINQCYPGSGITMEFEINELLAMFMEIAQSR